jgi:hypothetical protein
MSIGCKCFEVVRIGGQHDAAWFSRRHHQGVHCRAAASTPPQKGCSPCETLADLPHNVASLEKPILGGIPPGVTFEALDKHDGRNERRPQLLGAQCEDQSHRGVRPLRETAHSS